MKDNVIDKTIDISSEDGSIMISTVDGNDNIQISIVNIDKESASIVVNKKDIITVINLFK